MKKPSTPTLALAAAAVLALGAGVVAISRSAGDDAPAPGAHGAARPEQPVADVDSMTAALEARLKANPNDAAGWRMLGWSMLETGRFADAAAAYRRVVALEPQDKEGWSALGEALQSDSRRISPEAQAAFRRVLALDPKDPRARYFLAVQRDLGGDHKGAVDDWLALLADTPAGAPWEANLRQTIAQVAKDHDIALAGRMPAAAPAVARGNAATAAIPGPSAAQMADAAALPPGAQQEMVRGMVERLDSRLGQNARDADGWMRLMRARMVLGETARAKAALDRSLAAFANDRATQSRLRTAARELGVPGA